MKLAAALIVGLASAAQASIPVFTEEFTSLMSQFRANDSKLLVKEDMAYDMQGQRSQVHFSGPAFREPFSQLGLWGAGKLYAWNQDRCQVKNITGKIGAFFDMPANATFDRNVTVAGKACEEWRYWDQGQPFRFAFTFDSSHNPIPVRVEAVGRWYSIYSAFTIGMPPHSRFEPPSICANATEGGDLSTAPTAWA